MAYNLTEPAENWKHGPVHIFEAELHAKVVRETEANFHSDVTMLFECRPINASFIKCQVQNATLENYQMMDNNETRLGREKVDWFKEFGGINFLIEFDALGIKNLTFPKPQGYHREMVIRFIFDSLNVGIDLTDKSFDSYDAIDKSLYGDCPTNFKITKLAKRVANKELSLKRDVAVRKLMIIPFLNEFSDDATILIEKEKKMTKCLNKKVYIFGSDKPTEFDRENGLVPETDVVSLRPRLLNLSSYLASCSIVCSSSISDPCTNRNILG